MTTHLYAPTQFWPATYCDRNRPWHEPVFAVYPVDLGWVDCLACVEALLAEMVADLAMRDRLLAERFGPLLDLAS